MLIYTILSQNEFADLQLGIKEKQNHWENSGNVYSEVETLRGGVNSCQGRKNMYIIQT